MYASPLGEWVIGGQPPLPTFLLPPVSPADENSAGPLYIAKFKALKPI